MIKVIASSDFHGTLPEIEESFDLFLICGDVCPVWDHSRQFHARWLKNDFKNWIKGLPYKDENSRVVMVFGNHDLVCDEMKESKVKNMFEDVSDRLVILFNEVYEFNCGDKVALKIFGTPYCKVFGRWAFMRQPDELEEKYGQCPEGVDIFISHDSPGLNNLGTILEGVRSGVDAGNYILAKHVERVKPRYFFSGHIHSGNHEFSEREGTMMANVSLLNENYNPVFEPLVFDIETI